jgi:hypothetical protein
VAFLFFEEEEEEGDDITHLEVQRQAASALMWLAKRAGTNTYVEDVGGASLFEELKKSGDPRLEFIAAKGLEHMLSTRTHCLGSKIKEYLKIQKKNHPKNIKN